MDIYRLSQNERPWRTRPQPRWPRTALTATSSSYWSTCANGAFGDGASAGDCRRRTVATAANNFRTTWRGRAGRRAAVRRPAGEGSRAARRPDRRLRPRDGRRRARRPFRVRTRRPIRRLREDRASARPAVAPVGPAVFSSLVSSRHGRRRKSPALSCPRRESSLSIVVYRRGRGTSTRPTAFGVVRDASPRPAVTVRPYSDTSA